MGRTLRAATSLLACAALAPACFLDGGPFPADGGGPGTGGTAASGAGGSGAAGGTGGEGGTPIVCGDGSIDPPEQCDDQNTLSLDGCSSQCIIEPGYACTGEPSDCEQTCGDGELNTAVGEQCDDGDVDTGDGCNQGCQVEPGYVCTNPRGDDAPSVCIFTCGNGILDGADECDDGGTRPLDGCSADCKPEPGWICSNADGDDKPTVCIPDCGDGVIVGGETCDDGDDDGAVGCNADCTGPAPGWYCDTTGGPGSCTTQCNDGIVAAGGEGCEDGNTSDGDGCSSQCLPESFCGNGIVDPTEECDPGPGGNPDGPCDSGCKLAPGSACGDAILIASGAPDAAGVRISEFEHPDSDAIDIPEDQVPSPSCKGNFNFPVLHRYTTGDRPSILTVEAMDKTVANANTFNNTVVWVYRDCPGKRDVEACDDDGGAGKHSKLTTGFLPALTTVFIVLAGEGGGGDKGRYRLRITEQPVKLFYHQDFGAETLPGTYPLPASMTQTPSAGASWATCVEGGSVCQDGTPDSHSRGAFGWGSPLSGMMGNAVLRTPVVNLGGLTQAYASYTFKVIDGTGSEQAKVDPFNGVVLVPGGHVHNAPSSGRTVLAMPLFASARIEFFYSNGGSTTAGTFSIDDLYVYGY